MIQRYLKRYRKLVKIINSLTQGFFSPFQINEKNEIQKIGQIGQIQQIQSLFQGKVKQGPAKEKPTKPKNEVKIVGKKPEKFRM
jgi:hypothetical protein